MKVGIINFPGTSCENEVQRLFKELLEVQAEVVWHEDAEISQYDALIIPNGAAYGHYLRPGALAKASSIRHALEKFAASGKPLLGIGNGFQILVELGLLPGAFLMNPSLKFESGKTTVRVSPETLFTSAYQKEKVVALPFAHQFGHYVLTEEVPSNQIMMTYEDNRFDAAQSIAAVTNAKGNVAGMMILPERATESILGSTDGLAVFQSMIMNGSDN